MATVHRVYTPLPNAAGHRRATLVWPTQSSQNLGLLLTRAKIESLTRAAVARAKPGK